MSLSDRPAIRGQLEGPISFGLNVVDQDQRPILFDDTVRALLLDFMARRINIQLNRLKRMNPNAFMFVDEPGLQYIFSALSGYDSISARRDWPHRGTLPFVVWAFSAGIRAHDAHTSYFLGGVFRRMSL